jgi:hypothetical protein
MSAMLAQNPDAAKIARIDGVRRHNDAGEADARVSAMPSSSPSTSRSRYIARTRLEFVVGIQLVSRSFAERRSDAEPHDTDESRYDHRDNRLEGIALCLLDVPSPPPQVLKISAKLPSIILVYPKRR